MEGRVLTGNMTFYTGDMKNAFKLPVKYPIMPKADIKSEKEVKAKKDTTIAALQRNQAVTWVKNGDGDVEPAEHDSEARNDLMLQKIKLFLELF